jgi:sulfide:quinone oxidoreductase
MSQASAIPSQPLGDVRQMDTESEAEGRAAVDRTDGKFTVLIAGGGVAALEAILALTALEQDSIEIELVTPNSSFSLAALSVAQPFGGGEPRQVDLSEFCAARDVELRLDSLAEVWGEQRRILTGSCEEIPYDALLLAFGARRVGSIPGARPFRGGLDVQWLSRLLGRIESGSTSRVIFALPEGVRWSLPLFELALSTSRWSRERRGEEASLRIVAADLDPLRIFGWQPARRINELLDDAGIELITGTVAERFEDGVLHCEDGHAYPADAVITLPDVFVPDVPGLPQGRGGFIGCDSEMRVDGLESVWIAGDASCFPIMLGGIAAQQAETAAAGIATAAGLEVEPQPFRPMIRSALLTGAEPEFLRADMDEEGGGQITTSPLWWPPIKVAGPRLAPFLAREWSESGDRGAEWMMDIDEADRSTEAEHRAALQISLDYAELDAREGDLQQALRWLDVAERLNVILPPEFVERRKEWHRAIEAHGEQGS